jgi:Bacterial Ig-like domain
MTTQRNSMFLTLVLVGVLLTSCDALGPFLGRIGIDVIAPTVILVSPEDQDVDIPRNAAIIVDFSEVMSTVTAEYAFHVNPTVEGSTTWAYGDRSMTFIPAAVLETNTAYTVSISTLAEDENGNALEDKFTSVFTTGTTSDNDPPSAVTGFSVAADGENLNLGWTNPSDPDFAGVRVVYRTDRYSTGPSDGTELYAGRASSVAHEGLTGGVVYFYTAYAYDQALNYSGGVNASATAPQPSVVWVHQDDFNSDTRGEYDIYVRSNDNGVLNYSPDQLGLAITGWNGIRISHSGKTQFPEYSRLVFQWPALTDSTSYFIFEIVELGNQGASSWPDLNLVNSLSVAVYSHTVYSYVISDPSSNPDSDGETTLMEESPVSLSEAQWYQLEIDRSGTNVTISIDSVPIRTMSIPSHLLDLEMSVGIGIGSHNGDNGIVDVVEYGNY